MDPFTTGQIIFLVFVLVFAAVVGYICGRLARRDWDELTHTMYRSRDCEWRP